MRFAVSDLIAPHYCCSCGVVGKILCDYCKYDIISSIPVFCLQCLKPVGRFGDVCKQCKTYYAKGWVVGHHRAAIKQLIAEYKFHSAKSAGNELALLLSEALPNLPNDVIITSVPTVHSHIRQRGYDHTSAIAAKLAKDRHLPFSRTLKRQHNYTQRGSNKSTRLAQAKEAFGAVSVQVGAKYLLIDDVCTTGATVNYAAKALLDAGASEVWVAVVSREPLD